MDCPVLPCAVTWARPTQTTRYQVTVSDPRTGCSASRDLTVAVLPCTLAIPSAFSPNGDGVNDTFRVLVNPCLGRLRQLSIYNRWGQVIFHQEINSAFDKLFDWDGTFQGELVRTGVYSYQLTIESATGKVSRRTGALTMVH